ncbi:MAG: DUF6356 family protein [Pseudomonadota bacterium]
MPDQLSLYRRYFVDHPEAVGESYFQHAREALSYSGRFALMSLACLLHAIVPGCCTSTASTRVRKLVAELDARLPCDTESSDAESSKDELREAA